MELTLTALPSALNTRLLDEVLEAGPENVGRQFYEKALKQQQSGGAPMEKGVALALFLASNKSDGISGKLISALWDKWDDWPDYLDALYNSDLYTLRRISGKDRGVN